MGCVHFVGFRDDRYWAAVKIWGRPAVVHRVWDQRARREIAEDDVVVFATGDEHQPVARFNGNDIDEAVYDRLGIKA